MILLVDIGNSRIKWGFADGGRVRHHGAVAWAGRDLTEVLESIWTGIPVPTAVWVACVAGPSQEGALAHWCRENWELGPCLIRASSEACGVRNGYRDPAQLGADRWVALIGAHHLVSGPACVVDCGTAVTIDGLTGDGQHLGGLILPGMDLMRRALGEATFALSADMADAEDGPLGRNTASAMAGGCLQAVAGAIERASAALQRQVGADLHLVLTGGDAERLRPGLARQCDWIPDLTLCGLRVMAEAAS